jgi:hypothetical protein
MSAVPPPAAEAPPPAAAGRPAPPAEARWTARLPAWARPRAMPSGGDPAGPDVRGIETVLVILVGCVLAAAVAWDVDRQTGVNTRVAADKATWTAYSHRKVKKLGVRLLLRGTTDFVCAPSTSKLPRLCLMIAGPTRAGRRPIQGGYYLPPKREDRFISRYACFGLPARRHLCGAKAPPP